MTANNNSPEVGRLDAIVSAWIDASCGISWFLIVCSLVFIVGNWVWNFLHVPIGIKDNPPQPDFIVRYAQHAVWPLLIAWLVLRGVKFIFDNPNPHPRQ
jgi:hypothetical protein